MSESRQPTATPAFKRPFSRDILAGRVIGRAYTQEHQTEPASLLLFIVFENVPPTIINHNKNFSVRPFYRVHSTVYNV